MVHLIEAITGVRFPKLKKDFFFLIGFFRRMRMGTKLTAMASRSSRE